MDLRKNAGCTGSRGREHASGVQPFAERHDGIGQVAKAIHAQGHALLGRAPLSLVVLEEDADIDELAPLIFAHLNTDLFLGVLLDLGDLSGNTLTGLACPKNLIGTVSVFLVAHHGDYDSNVPALYAALRPQVAIMNNGVTKGGAPVAFTTLHAQTGMDLWQLHRSQNPGAENAPELFIANLDEGTTAYWIKLTANEDGSFRILNGRTGVTKPYSPRPGIDRR